MKLSILNATDCVEGVTGGDDDDETVSVVNIDNDADITRLENTREREEMQEVCHDNHN